VIDIVALLNVSNLSFLCLDFHSTHQHTSAHTITHQHTPAHLTTWHPSYLPHPQGQLYCYMAKRILSGVWSMYYWNYCL